MRVPPLTGAASSGSPSRVARSIAVTSRSADARPIEPARNANSPITTATRRPCISALAGQHRLVDAALLGGGRQLGGVLLRDAGAVRRGVPRAPRAVVEDEVDQLRGREAGGLRGVHPRRVTGIPAADDGLGPAWTADAPGSARCCANAAASARTTRRTGCAPTSCAPCSRPRGGRRRRATRSRGRSWSAAGATRRTAAFVPLLAPSVRRWAPAASALVFALHQAASGPGGGRARLLRLRGLRPRARPSRT